MSMSESEAVERNRASAQEGYRRSVERNGSEAINSNPPATARAVASPQAADQPPWMDTLPRSDEAAPGAVMNWAGGPPEHTPGFAPGTPLSNVHPVPNCNEQLSGVDAIVGHTGYGSRRK